MVKPEFVSIRSKKNVKYIIYLFFSILPGLSKIYIHIRWQMPMMLSFFCVGVIYGFVIVLSQPNRVPTNVNVVFCYHMNPVILIYMCPPFL
jgi:hypothetical protein